MWKCGNYIESGINDCLYQDDRCCWYCEEKQKCHANSKCYFNCYDDDNDNEDDVNAYWVED